MLGQPSRTLIPGRTWAAVAWRGVQGRGYPISADSVALRFLAEDAAGPAGARTLWRDVSALCAVSRIGNYRDHSFIVSR
jgi:hypothetical protein